MKRRLARFGLATFLFLASTSVPAAAQWGYGGWGWGGWGGETVDGANARGAGMFLAGAGSYNLDTAQANSINADTVMRVNEYLYSSQQLINERYWRRAAEKRQDRIESMATIQNRLRNSPEAADVRRGDALNVLLNDLTAPGIYAQSVSAATQRIPSALVKEIPFQYAPQAISISFDQILREPPPELVRDPRLTTEREAVRAVADKAFAEIDANDQASPETLKELEAAVLNFRNKFQATIPHGTPNRRPAENYIKALYGLTRMLQVPDVKQFLRDLDNQPDTTLGHLIDFMQSFNLRFGAATTPAQGNAYMQLYPSLRALRDQVNPQTPAVAATTIPSSEHLSHAQEFFSGMEFTDQPQPNAAETPAPPAPNQP